MYIDPCASMCSYAHGNPHCLLAQLLLLPLLYTTAASFNDVFLTAAADLSSLFPLSFSSSSSSFSVRMYEYQVGFLVVVAAARMEKKLGYASIDREKEEHFKCHVTGMLKLARNTSFPINLLTHWIPARTACCAQQAWEM